MASVTPQKRFKTLEMACKVGLIGGALTIPAAIISLFVGFTILTMQMKESALVSFSDIFKVIVAPDPFGGMLALVLAVAVFPLIWGPAFLTTCILCLRNIHKSVSHSPAKVAGFACLTFLISILLALFVLGPFGFFGPTAADFIPLMGLPMLAGFGIAAIGLAVWAIRQRRRRTN